MNKATMATMLLAIATWLYPIKVAATPKVETKIETSQDYESGALVIKDDAIQPIYVPTPKQQTSQPVSQKRDTRSNGLYSGRHYSKEEVQQLIKDYSAQYGISADLSLRIANCESGFNQTSKNKSSTASGVFQYLSGTWKNTESGRAGVSVFDAEANVRMAVSSIAANGTAPWNASKGCWNK